MEAEKRIQESEDMSVILDFIITLLILLGIFFLAYMAYRKQSILDTIREIKESFNDTSESIKENITYK